MATNKQIELTRQGQLTDRYSKAVEQLGSDSTNVRLGGIYALERLMHDSPADHPTIIEVLAAFIRDTTSKRPIPSPAPTSTPDPRVISAQRPADLLAALTVLGRRDTRHDALGHPVDLSFANLAGLNLSAMNLAGVNLLGAHLQGSRLIGTKLTNAILATADLTYANLAAADLTCADFFAANLTQANLDSADLTGADLRSANLTGANLNRATLAQTRTEGALSGAIGTPSSDQPGPASPPKCS